MAFDDNAPAADTGVSSGQSNPAPDPSSQNLGQNTAPAVRDFSDDDLVRVPGMSEPVKYGDIYRRLQADHTKKTTEAARLKAQLERERGEWMTAKQREEANLKQLATELLSRARGGQGQGQDIYAQLEAMNYLDGKTAAKLFRELQENGIGSTQKAIQERDEIIRALYQHVSQLSQTVNGLQGQSRGQSFEQLIDKTLRESGIPAEARDWAKEVYLAYEQSPDFNDEFPEILRTRWNQLQNLYQSGQKARVEAARKRPFGFPGKGGNGTAGKQLELLKGNESAKKTADTLWEAIQANNESET